MERKRFTRRGATSTLGVAFLVLIVALAGGCGGEEQPTEEPVDEAVSSAEEQGAAETTAEPADDAAVSIGEPVAVGDAQWTVTDAEELDQLVSRLGTSDGDFITTEVTFVNNSNQDVALAAPSLTLLDGEGREFEVDLENTFTHVEGSRNMFVDQVPPGATKEGLVVFSVTPDASGFELRVGDTTNFVSDEYGYIDLGF